MRQINPNENFLSNPIFSVCSKSLKKITYNVKNDTPMKKKFRAGGTAKLLGLLLSFAVIPGGRSVDHSNMIL